MNCQRSHPVGYCVLCSRGSHRAQYVTTEGAMIRNLEDLSHLVTVCPFRHWHERLCCWSLQVENAGSSLLDTIIKRGRLCIHLLAVPRVRAWTNFHHFIWCFFAFSYFILSEKIAHDSQRQNFSHLENLTWNIKVIFWFSPSRPQA